MIIGRLAAIAVATAIGLIVVGIAQPEPWALAPDERPVAIATLPCRTSLQSTSSGFIVDDERVVTVAHAIYESRDFAVRDADGTWHRARVQHLDLDLDLAMLVVDGLRATPMSTARATADTPVRMVEGAATGSAHGTVTRPVNIETSVVGDLDRTAKRSGYELALDIGPGDSGAAIVDGNDDLVAIVFARSTRSEGVTWATAAAEIGRVVGSAELPTWECRPGAGAELVLTQPEQERLAG